MKGWATAVAGILAAACTCGRTGGDVTDAGPGADAGPAHGADAGVADSGGFDAGDGDAGPDAAACPGRDGGPLDAGPADGGLDGGAPCAIRVPLDRPTIADGIATAPSPGVVCVDPGSYAGDVTLRDGISVRGTAPGVVLRGAVKAGAATGQGASLTLLRIEGRATCADGTAADPPLLGLVVGRGGVRLTLSRVELVRTSDPPELGCANPAGLPFTGPAAAVLAHRGSGSLKLVAEQVTVAEPPGFIVRHEIDGARIDDRVTVHRSRCAHSACHGFVALDLADASGATLPAGSRVTIDVVNNVVGAGALDVNLINLAYALAPADAAASRAMFRHNTIVGACCSTGVRFLGTGPPALEVANNVFVDVDQPLAAPGPGAYQELANAKGTSTRGAAAWFRDFAGGDLHPAPCSPLLSGGDPAFGTAVDFDGWPRVGGFDVGAFQGR